MEVSTGFRARRGAHTGQQRGEGGKQGGGQLRGAHWRLRRAPACLPGEGKQLTGVAAGLGRLGGLASWAARLVPSLSLFYLSFFIYSVTLWTY